MVNNQKFYAKVVDQNSLPQPKTQQTFSFTAEQLTKFVANVVIQIAQPQVCYPNPKQGTLDLNSTLIPHCGNFKFHITYTNWIPTVELECNLYGTESHSIRLWKERGIKVELTFRRINSTLQNPFEPSLSGVDG